MFFKYVTSIFSYMKVGIVLATNSLPQVEKALRLANRSLGNGSKVELFLLFEGVRLFELTSKSKHAEDLFNEFTEKGGKVTACRACASAKGVGNGLRCEMSSLATAATLRCRSDRYYFVTKRNKIKEN